MSAAPRLRLPLAVAVALIGFVCLLSPSALADSTSSNAYAQLVRGDSPLAYWRLNGTSTSTTDATGHGHTLQWVDPLGMSRTPTLGAQALPSLQPDTAVQFDGADSAPYGKVQNNGSLNPETFSVEAWVKPIGDLPDVNDGTIREAIISSYSGCEPLDDSIGCELRGYQLYISNYENWGAHPQFAFSTGNDTATGQSNKNWVVDTQTTVKKDTWYHVVATATPRSNGNAEMHLYVNGKNVANCPEDGAGTCPRSGTFDPKNSDEPTYLGLGTREGAKTYRLGGEMDELAVYNSVLTPAQVLEHYNAGTYSAQPTLSLTYSSDPSTFTGGRVGLSLSVGNVSDASGTSLTAQVTGKNPQSIPVTVDGTSATFSYKGTTPGTDTVRVSGIIDGYSVESNPLKVFWLAGAASAAGSFGDSSSDIYAYVPTCFWGDPVNSVTGNFYETYTDAKLPGTGIPFSLDHTYNSLDNTVGPLGKGWSAGVFTSLAIDEAGNVTVKGAGGEEVGYILQDDGSFKADSNVTAKLTKTSSGYDLVLDDQNVQHFDSGGSLVSWLDPNGQGLHFAYNGDGRLARVADSGGREVDFSYDSDGRLVQVTLPDSSTISYGHDGDRLTSVTDQTGAVTHYAYDANGFLASATDGSGKVLFQNTYDDEGRVLTQTDPSGNTVHFDWSAGTASDPSGTWTDSYTDRNELAKRVDALGDTTTYSYNAKSEPVSTTDPLGDKTTMTYDERGNMLTQTDALGNTESWTYDQDNNVLSHTDKLGNTTNNTYDSSGNLLTETDPLGNVTRYEYDSAGRQISETDPLGRETKSVYDDQGNLIESISPSGAKTSYAYDANGNKISETDPLGNTTAFEYDAAGRLLKTTDPLGHSTTSTYDDAGRLLAQTNANGNKTRYVYDDAGRQIEVIAPDGSTTKSSYDELGNLVASTDALGKVTHYEYDPLGRQIATISPTGERTETTYDANGNVTDAQDPLGNKTKSVFDALGREIESTDAMGRTTKTVYDADGNVTKKIDALGNATTTKYDADGRVVKETDPLGYSTTTTYDAAGQTISETDANGGVTLHSYDSDGNEVSTTDPSGAVSTSAYDAAGNLASSTDPLGHTTTYSYDAAGNKISQVNPLGAKTTYSYDPNGNEISETDPLGNVSKKVYDSQNRKVKQIDPLDNVSKTSYDLDGNVVAKTDPLGATTSYEYDSEGRLVKETDPLGNSKTSSYDKAGRLVSATDANGHTTQYTYDAAGQKTSVTAPGGAVTSFDYDAAGRLVSRTDANGHTTTYAYDASGRKTAKTDPLDRTWHYAYDGNGNLVETKAPSGGTISQSYDSENRPTAKTYSDGTASVFYAYDLAGNKTSVTDGTGTTRYTYDAANERTGALRAEGSFFYTYDLDGNILSRTYPNGLKTSYSYNAANEMATASANGQKTYYSYDPDGRLSSTLHPDGIVDRRTYDSAGHLTTVSGAASSGSPFYSRSYSYDQVGNPLTMSAYTSGKNLIGWAKPDKQGSWTETYSYDSRDRLLKACMDSACSRNFSYSYDPVGNMLQKKSQDGTTAYSYDAADELLSAVAGDKVTNYAYDQNGNETKEGDTSYSYNLENELLSEKGQGKPVSYTYTGEGLMATRSTPSDTTSYAWDTETDIPNLATESDVQGKKAASSTYTYAQGPLGLITGSGPYSFHTDALGSIVEVSDQSGKSAQSYRYDPFGDAYAPGNSSQAASNLSNSLQYAGQYLDEDSDLYYMRAREYDPETARFLETDPVTCDQGGSCGSVYVYVDDRPTVDTDPSGACPIDNGTPTCMKNWWKWGEKPDASRLTGKAYRARIVAIVRYTIQHNTAIDYSEDLNGPKERMQGIRAHIRFPHLPRYEDCSSYVDWVYWTAGVPKDPMGNGYNGSPYNNNTGNLSCDGEKHTCGSPRYRSHVVTEENAKPGDLVFYFAGGSWPWSHVEIYLGGGIVAGNGVQSDPQSHPIDQYGRHGQIRSYFPELLK